MRHPLCQLLPPLGVIVGTISGSRSVADPAIPARTVGSAVSHDVPSFHRPPLSRRKALPARIPLRGAGCVPTLAGDHDSALPYLTSRLFEIRCFLRDPASPAVSKDHPDPANPATRPACADLKLLTIEWMSGIDNRTIGGSRSDTVAATRRRSPSRRRAIGTNRDGGSVRPTRHANLGFVVQQCYATASPTRLRGPGPIAIASAAACSSIPISFPDCMHHWVASVTKTNQISS